MKKLKWTNTPYGYREAIYRNHIINDSNGEFMPEGITVDFDGDLAYCENLEDAMDKIDENILWGLKDELQHLGGAAAGFKVSYEKGKFILIRVASTEAQPVIEAMNKYVQTWLSEDAQFVDTKDGHWVLEKF